MIRSLGVYELTKLVESGWLHEADGSCWLGEPGGTKLPAFERSCLELITTDKQAALIRRHVGRKTKLVVQTYKH